MMHICVMKIVTACLNRAFIIGNVNDRSLLGERDSEMAIIVEDQDLVGELLIYEMK